MNNQHKIVISTLIAFVALLTCSTVYAQNKIIGEDSETNMTSNQLLDDINPSDVSSTNISNTGYEHLIGKTIVYGFALDGTKGMPSISLLPALAGMSPAYGYVSARVNANGKVYLLSRGSFFFNVPPGYVSDYPVTSKYYVDSHGNNVVEQLYLSNKSNVSGASSLSNAESINLGDQVSASISPAGLSVRVHSKDIGAYHSAFIPWPTSLKFAKAMVKDRSQPYAILLEMNHKNNPSSSDLSQSGYVYQSNLTGLSVTK